MRLHRGADGRLLAIANPGGYSIVYYTADCALLCADCANGENGSEASDTHDERQWRIIGADVRWEGPTEQCAHCGVDLPSEYGDPNA